MGKYGTTPTAKLSTSVGPNDTCSLQPLLRLTADMKTVRTKIDALSAEGETNVAMGLIWGWHLLSPLGPFSDGVPYGTPDLTKYAIVMTDGENTFNEVDNRNRSNYSGLGFIRTGRLGITNGSNDERTEAMDERLETLCTNMKASGIEIFTVRVEVRSGSTTLLRNCATRPDMFFEVADSSNLEEVFSLIGETISKLRLSK